ncbi:MAG: hypothetical protein INQ03_22740 [Candidatus Heimdallarchaeota archaeon]|nr:hypothetical protein [Candidatus Heimdallarchaeota archaeon]
MIESNQDLLDFAVDNSLQGNGTQENPIILSDQQINASASDQSLIYLKNTDLYFQIIDCDFIGIQGVAQIAIRLESVSHVSIINSTFTDLAAIVIFTGNDIKMSGNIFNQMGFGLMLNEVATLEVSDNSFKNLDIGSSNGVEYSFNGNIFENCSLAFQSVNSIEFYSNNFSNYSRSNPVIDFNSVQSSSLNQNIFSDINSKAVHYQGSSNIQIAYNTFTEVFYPIHIEVGENATISKSVFSGFTTAITVDAYAHAILVYKNSFLNFSGSVASIGDNLVYNDNDFDNGEYGNYYDDYPGIGNSSYDVNGDGIGDVPYSNFGNGDIIDNYPLMDPEDFDAPIITSPGDLEMTIGEEYAIEWSIDEVRPTTYTLKANETVVASGNYKESISYTPSLAVGYYELNLTVNDVEGYTSSLKTSLIIKAVIVSTTETDTTSVTDDPDTNQSNSSAGFLDNLFEQNPLLLIGAGVGIGVIIMIIINRAKNKKIPTKNPKKKTSKKPPTKKKKK